jgi:hypothetical protein
MSAALPSSLGTEPIARRPLAWTEALTVLAPGATAGTGASTPVAQTATTTHPSPRARSAAAAVIAPVLLPRRHDRRFAWAESHGSRRGKARHSGKCVHDVGTSTSVRALLGGTATGC